MSDLSPNTIVLSDGAATTAGTTLNYNGAGRFGGGIDGDGGSYQSTTATPNVLTTGDTINVDGTNLQVTDIAEYSVTVTHEDGARSDSGVPFAIVTLSDGSKFGLFLDGSNTYVDVRSITLDSATGGTGPIDETALAAVDTGEGPADGIVDGTDAGKSMGSGYVDAQGDGLDNSGSNVKAHGGDDTVFGGWGDDTIDGGTGNDMLFGGDGNDLMFGGAGHDSLWGDEGNDTLYGKDGDDKLIGGAGDDLIIGGAGDDTLIGDNNPGDHGGINPSDPAEPGFGNDTLVLDGGNDKAYGGSGDDEFRIFDGFGNHTIVGGETGETEGDTLNAGALSDDVSVIYTGDESGTITDGSGTANFTEIERLDLGSGDDRVEILTSTSGTVNGSDGFDTLVLPDPLPGETPPNVTITNTIDNGDGTFTYSGYVDFDDGSRMDFENFEEIICFTPGTLIDTLRGKVAVETLVPGDKVLTRDHGYQSLAWVGRRDLTAAELATCPAASTGADCGGIAGGEPARA
ncbi:Hint domain-containing protein [Pararhodobacter sp.]|uniref:Hint domain-containing protein n=1 Tax=Pararhodobacter sp. TaxID=2127056 RepID=UPI002AFE2A92|nr:Hint domain-containing protein [Pararhodobacter sp.]